MKLLDNIFKKSEPKAIRMEKEDIETIKLFHEAETPAEDIASAMEQTTTRINYEIKQIETKENSIA